MNQTVAIIDHVGAKAGMDYYSGLLASGIAKNGGRCLLFSNFVLKDSRVISYPYFAKHLDNAIHKAIDHIVAFFRSAITCRREHCRNAIVHIFSFGLKDVYSLAVLRMFGIRVTGIVHDIESFAGKRTNSWGQVMLHTLADRIIVHNRFSFNQLLEVHGNSLAGKTNIIPHGNFHELPDKSLTRIVARRRLGLKEDEIYLLFFGQIKEVKGLELLLKALAVVPQQVSLVIAGKPWKSDFDRYDNMIADLGIGDRVVRIIRFIEDYERELLFHACDILILPYKQIFQSGVLLMAMSYGIPVIASDLEPNREVIEDNITGLLFETGNPEDLAGKIIKAVNDPAGMTRMAERGWEKLEKKNNWNDIAHEMMKQIAVSNG